MNKIKIENKINYKNMMKVEEKYQDLVTDIVCYLRVELNEEDSEEAVNDINDILLSAQDRGEDLYEVVGDYQIFCKEVIASYKEGVKGYGFKHGFGMLKYFIPLILGGFILFMAIDIVLKFPYKEVNSLKELLGAKYILTSEPIMILILGLTTIIGFFKLTVKSPSKSKMIKRDNIMFILVYIIIVASLVLVAIFTRKIELISFENFGIGFILAFIVIISLIAYMFYDSRKGKKESLKKD